ncbi:MAG: PPC domain-containing protein, partial [Methylohalobius sp.]
MKIKAITIAVTLALGSQAAWADLLDQLKDPTGCVLGCPPAGGGGGGGEAVTPLAEVEPNDTPQTATSLVPGQLQSGAFQASGDQDWYRFRVTQAGTAATLELPPQRRGFQLTLQSASGQVLARFQNDGKETRKFAVVLPQLGDFFLVAESLGASSYTFTLSGEGISPPTTGPGGLPEGALTEIEPNDIQQTATALKPDAFHGGQVSAADSDFFRFQVTAAGAIEVFLPGSNGEFTLTILDTAGRVLASQKSAVYDQNFIVVASALGDYFVRLSAQAAAPVSYLFKLKSDTIALPLDRRNEFLRQAQREVEPNDNLVASNPIIPGRPVAGQLRIKEDEDWFALRTTRDNTVINVEVPKGPAKWRISILDAAGNLLDQRESATDSDLVFSSTIERAGKFYLSIAAVDDTRADYAFNVTGEGLQNPSDRNPNANFHNVEIEPNDVLKDANPLTSAVRLLG